MGGFPGLGYNFLYPSQALDIKACNTQLAILSLRLEGDLCTSSEVLLQLPPLWYSVLGNLAALFSPYSAVLRETAVLCLGSPSLLCSLETPSSKLGQLKALLYVPLSLVTVLPLSEKHFGTFCPDF